MFRARRQALRLAIPTPRGEAARLGRYADFAFTRGMILHDARSLYALTPEYSPTLPHLTAYGRHDDGDALRADRPFAARAMRGRVTPYLIMLAMGAFNISRAGRRYGRRVLPRF